MIVTVKDGYRIMIPREIRESMNIQLGDEMELTNIQNKVLVLSPVDVKYDVVNDSKNEVVDSSIYDNSGLTEDIDSTDTRKVVIDKPARDEQVDKNELEIRESDKWHTGITKEGVSISYRVAKLKDGVEPNKYLSNTLGCEKYYRRTFSRCGLVARTKLKYINDFCGACKGQLLDNYKDVEDCICPYRDDYNSINESIATKEENKVEEKSKSVEIVDEPKIKEVSKNIRDNINQLNRTTNLENVSERLENKVLNVQLEKEEKMLDEEIQEINKAMKKKVQCVQYDNESYNVCSVCEELNNKGYLIDGNFYCSKCFREDFMSFLEKYRRLRRENVKC